MKIYTKSFRVIPSGKIFFLLFVFISLMILSSNTIKYVLPAQNTVKSGKNHNVCKTFKGKILLYIIWAKTRQSYEWTDYEINSTVDSLNIAINWLNQQAENNNILLNIRFDYSQGDSIPSFYQKLGGSVEEFITKSAQIERINKWADKIVRKATGLKNKERLIAKLRDENNTESVALIFILNNYFKADYAFSFNTTSNEDVEYSIISTKRPCLIAQEILNLFGAPYLYQHTTIKNKRDTKQLQQMFKDDIMATSDKNISQLTIGEITKYYIGWIDEIKDEYEKLIKEKTKL